MDLFPTPKAEALKVETVKPKAYSYLRFSTPEQMKGDSLRRQLSMAREYAERHGLELDEELSFQDLGVSGYRGKNLENGRLGEFLEAVRQGLVPKGSYLLVESLDRISRQTARKALRVLERIVEEGIVLVTLTDGRAYTIETIDNDPMALMMALVIFMRSNDESAMKSRRGKAAWQNKRAIANVKKLTSKCPSWLRLEGDTFIVDEVKAAVVNRIYRMAAEGVGQHKIAETLNKEGVPCFGKGVHWHKSYITKLLQSDAPIGTCVPHTIEHDGEGKKLKMPQQPIKGYYPAIISDELNDVVKLARTDVRSPVVKGEAKVTNIFASLAKCPLCKGSMTKVNKGKRRSRPYLVCTKAKVGAGCTYKGVPYDELESFVIENWDRWLGDMPIGSPELEDEYARLRLLIAETEGRIKSLVGNLSLQHSPALLQELKVLESEKEQFQKEMRECRAKLEIISYQMTVKRQKELKAKFSEGELDRGVVNRMLRVLLSYVIIDYLAGQLVFGWKQGGETTFIYDGQRYFMAAE